ncbi:MAG: TraR/DksA family transcriptional regulator [candidate division FCPU426 bacterium]
MKKKDLGPYRKMLLDLKEGLMREVLINQNAGKETHQDEVLDLADQASDAYDRELASSLSEAERGRLVAVEKALERVEKGSYGVCENCEKTIPLQRLKALPFARLCIDCQELEERAKR